IAIMIWHYSSALWEGANSHEYFPFLPSFVIWKAVKYFAWTLGFSGFAILFLSFFLMGYRGLKKPIKFVGFLVLGWILFSLVTHYPGDMYYLNWDIYPLLIVGFLSIYLLQKTNYRIIIGAGLFGFFLTWIPFWNIWTHFSHHFLKEIFVGDCQIEQGSFPLLPWIGLIWSGYGLGAWAQRSVWSRRRSWELYVWPVLLGITTPLLGTYTSIQAGSTYDCLSFRQPPSILWSHLIWIVFFIRLSFFEQVQSFLSKKPWVHFLSRFALTNKFWLFYFTHFMVIYFFTDSWGAFLRTGPWVSLLGLLLIFPVTELLIHVLRKNFKF
ncbi:MAG: hypothetical protein COT73_05910, partial [Bdellovibrio sp. CG10_big_fil_rev_8_21_14_0_10_47_8]